MRNKKGLTLVEVVVAMGLFGIIMVTLFPAFLLTNLMNIVSDEFTDANYLVQTEMEEVYNASKTSGATPTSVLTSLGYSCASSTCTKDDGDYHYIATFSTNSEVASVTNLLIVVSNPGGAADYNKDRAELELYLRFGE